VLVRRVKAGRRNPADLPGACSGGGVAGTGSIEAIARGKIERPHASKPEVLGTRHFNTAQSLAHPACRGVRSSSAAALANASFPVTQLEITSTRCNSFWLNANVSCLIG
jgi:hypothetical protein